MQLLTNIYFSWQLFGFSFFGTFVFAHRVPKRKYFYIKFILFGIVGSILSTYLWMVSKEYGGEYRQLYAALVSFFVLIEIFVIFYLSYKINVVECLTYVMAGWTMQHLSGKIQYFILMAFNIQVDYFNYTWQYTLINALCLFFTTLMNIIILQVFYKGDTRVKNPRIVFPLIIIVFVSVILSAFSPYDINKKSEMFLNFYAVAFCLISLCFIYWSFDNTFLLNQLKFVKQLDEKKAKQYEISKESIDIINNRAHDLKKFISKFGDSKSLLTDEEVQLLKKHIDYYDKRCKTGNNALDTIINEKIFVFDNKKIKFNYIVDISGLSIFTDFEIYTLFGNILDNAEEALVKCDVNNRYDELRISKKDNLLIIHNENYTKENVKIKNNTLFTSKKDVMYHGYGTNSIKETVKKHNGICTFSCNDNVFSVDILIPLKLNS